MTWKDINEEQKQTAGFNFDYSALLDDLLGRLPANPIVVELGTYLGCSAVYMAEHLKAPYRLYSVDLFDAYGESSQFFTKALCNVKACGQRDNVRLLSCKSWEAAQFFDANEVDMVWVDAGHDFVSAKADLDAWYPKIKQGGILAGHDYSEPGVALAVDRFSFAHSLKPSIINPTGWKSWWIQL